MTESGASSPEIQETNHIDIDELLAQDERDLQGSYGQKSSHIIESDEDELDNAEHIDSADDEEEDSEEAEAEKEARTFYHNLDDEELSEEARPPSPLPSPNPYAHPQILDHELDFDWDEDKEVRETVKAKARKKAGKLACVGLSSTASNAEIKWCLKYYDKGCIWARPHPWMRPHIFDYNP